MRRRLERTFVDDGIEPETRKLMAAIANLDFLTWLGTNRLRWHSHPGANQVLRHAIAARLQRLRPPGEAVFATGELAVPPLVASEDPQAIGLAIEAIDFHQPPMTPERRAELNRFAEAKSQELRRRHEQQGGNEKS